MSFPRYLDYRESGVDWLGPVPSHWIVTALKHAYSVTLGKMLQPDAASPEDAILPYLRAANIQWSGVDCNDIKTMWFSARDRKQLQLQPGDLLVSEGGDVGRSALWKGEIEECYFQNSVNRIRPLEGNITEFLVYWMSTMKDKGFIDVLCNKSTIAHFTAEKVGSVPVPLPPRHEQRAIATFLDLETAKIDALVEEQGRLIELLKEKRQVVISQAVTKGLNPNVPMKGSGVEWLGKVPAHWQTSRLANLFSNTDERGNDELPVLTVSIHDGVSDDELDEADMDRKVTRSADKTKYKRVAPGDLVYNMMRAWQGGFGSVTVDGMVSPAYVVARPLTEFPTSFVERVLRTPNAIEEMRGRSRGVTDFRLRLYWEEFKDIVVPLPPKDEVKAIVTHLNKSDQVISNTISVAEDCIAILQERRSALISAAVTGKIDVRGLATRADTVAA